MRLNPENNLQNDDESDTGTHEKIVVDLEFTKALLLMDRLKNMGYASWYRSGCRIIQTSG